MISKSLPHALLRLPALLPALLAGLGNAMAAEQISLESLQAAPTLSSPGTIHQLTGLSADELKTVRSLQFDAGRNSTRFQQYYLGVPIWGEPLVERRDTSTGKVQWHGPMLRNLAQDLPDVQPVLSAATALQQAKTLVRAQQSQNEQVQLYIKLKQNNVAHLFYLVSFVNTSALQPSRPFFMIDANSGAVLQQWEGINHAVGEGPGGNSKIGKYEYKVGGPYGPMEVTTSGSTCTLDNASLKTVDMKNRTTGSITPFAFTCPRNATRPVNGAYSPLNDAHYIGTAMVNMYKSWIGIAPLSQKFTMRVHYGTNYSNAFWDGSSMIFGDGDGTTFPATVPDVIGHEISHGFTEQHSKLVYSGQSGGINEAFSDMAGEALEYFIRGKNDFLVGADIFRGAGSVRSMSNPTSDGRSIDNLAKYTSTMDVHYSSGIYNKAFYLLATKPDWGTRKAFEVMAIANQLYWGPNTSFTDGACKGVTRATLDKGYRIGDVYSVFNAVGIICPIIDPPPGLTKGAPVTGVSLAKDGNRWYSFNVPAGKTNLSVKLSGGTGDGNLYMKLASTPTTTSYQWKSDLTGNNETISVDAPAAGTYSILLYGNTAVSGASLVGDYK